MEQDSLRFQAIGFLLLLNLTAPQTPEVMSADLKPQTLAAFARYVKLTEARIQKELTPPGAFLYVDGLAEPRRAQVLGSLRQGEIFMEQLKTTDSSGRPVDAPNGIIHHWMGAVFIPHATLAQTLEVVQDYAHHQDFYKPEVLRSRLVSHTGNDFKVYYRMRKKKVITVTLNTDHDVQYFPVNATHCYSRSYSTRIAEVADAGQPNEREQPVGHDGGFLWRINSYWRFEQRDGGTYVECESVSLTRDIPIGFGWLIEPFITGIPKESLQMTMGSTRAAVAARIQK